MIAGSEFLKWWRRELAVFSPSWFNVAFFGGTTAASLVFKADITGIAKNGNTFEAPTALLDKSSPILPRVKRPMVVDVLLPDAWVLKRRVTAPRKAWGKLSSLAALDLKRSTPFPDGSVLWALGKQVQEGEEIVTTQYVAKAADLMSIRRRLQPCGLTVRRFLAQSAGDTPVILQDLSAELAPGGRRWRMMNGGLVFAAFCSAVFLWGQPTWQAQQQLNTLKTELATLRSDALAQRQRVEALTLQRSESERLQSSLQSKPRLIETLRNVTVALPDEAWITGMTFAPETITLAGDTSAAAVDLVLALSGNRQFGNPRLSGPTTRTPSGREKFEIAATPGGAE